MPTQTAQIKGPIVRNLTGGLNVREAIVDIADNEAAAATNVSYFTAGAIVRRGGWKKLIANSPTTNKLMGIFQPAFVSGGTTSYFLVVTDGADMWQTSDPLAATVVWTKITGSVTLGATQPWHFVMMNNLMVAFNGAVAPVTWSGSGNLAAFPAPSSSQVTVPTSRIGIVWQNFLFWGGQGSAPNRLYFSTLGDPTTYPLAQFLDVPTPNDGDPVTGMAILYGNLMVFKRFSIYILQGTPPANLILSKLNSYVGCVEPASVIQVGNVIYFVSDKGLYEANLFNVRQASYKVEPRYLASVPSSTPANPIWAANYKPRGQLLITQNGQSLYTTAGTNNDRILAHDYFNTDRNQDPAVSEFIVNYTASGLAGAKPSNPTAPFIMGDYYYSTVPSTKSVTVMSSFYDQWVYVMTEGSTGTGGPADAIAWLSAPTYPPADFLSKFYDFGDPDAIKVMRWLWTTGQNYNNIKLAAGVVYNNSPTAVSFVDYNNDTYVLTAPNGNFYQLGVDDDGAITVTKVSTNTGATNTTLVLQDANSQNWAITVDNNGVLDSATTTNGSNTAPILASPADNQFQFTVDTVGALVTTQVFTPSTTTIIPGRRQSISALINGVGGATQGKYIQVYFTNVGILTQFSMDIIMKGRRI